MEYALLQKLQQQLSFTLHADNLFTDEREVLKLVYASELGDGVLEYPVLFVRGRRRRSDAEATEVTRRRWTGALVFEEVEAVRWRRWRDDGPERQNAKPHGVLLQPAAGSVRGAANPRDRKCTSKSNSNR